MLGIDDMRLENAGLMMVKLPSHQRREPGTIAKGTGRTVNDHQTPTPFDIIHQRLFLPRWKRVDIVVKQEAVVFGQRRRMEQADILGIGQIDARVLEGAFEYLGQRCGAMMSLISQHQDRDARIFAATGALSEKNCHEKIGCESHAEHLHPEFLVLCRHAACKDKWQGELSARCSIRETRALGGVAGGVRIVLEDLDILEVRIHRCTAVQL